MLFTSHLEANKAKRHTHLGDGGLRSSIPFALLLLVYFLSFSLTLFHSYVQIVFYGWGGCMVGFIKLLYFRSCFLMILGRSELFRIL